MVESKADFDKKKLQENQLVALKDMGEDVSKLIESFKQMLSKYNNMSRMRISADSDFFGQLLHITKVQLNAVNVINDEQTHIQQNAAQLKESLMIENKLQSDAELLAQQKRAFEFIQQMKSHIDMLYEISEFSRLTLQELQQQESKRLGFNDFADQIDETISQIKKGIKITQTLDKHLGTLISVQQASQQSERLLNVHNSLYLQKGEILALLSKIMSWNASLKKTLQQHHFSRQATRKDIDNCLAATVDILENKILPDYQKSMRYEQGMVAAINDINKEVEKMSKKKNLMDMQQEVRLFTASFRSDFKELNTKYLPQLVAALKATQKEKMSKEEYIFTYKNVWHAIHWVIEKMNHLQIYAEKATAYINSYNNSNYT